METLLNIPVSQTNQSALAGVNWSDLSFCKYVSDHMFTCHYQHGNWQDPKIVPFQEISLSPAALVLHYGQAVFEGMKAFRMHDGAINIFRMDKHHERLNKSLDRMCMPPVSYELFTAALTRLVQTDKAWMPSGNADTALYIRPLVFASEGRMGVKVSDEYLFIIMTAPVSMMYQKPLSVKVERQFIRAAKGGTGFAKCSGNYGGSFYASQKAREEGFDNVLWMDAVEHEYVEESGAMNLLFILDGKLVTPPVSDTILNGITRDSLLVLAKEKGIEVEERPVSITEIINAVKEGRQVEAFGAGTAAVVAPISTIGVDGEVYQLPPYSSDSIMFQLKEALEAIRSGRADDRYGWNFVLPA